MIQRIQTIYLLLAAIASAALLFIPIATIVPDPHTGALTAFGLTINGAEVATAMPVWVLGMFLVLSTLLRVVAIFGYKNRKNQMRTCRSSILADLCFLALTGILIWQVTRQMPDGMSVSFAPYIACVLIVLSIVLTLLAIRGIRHDEKLVRAADRLR